MAFNLDFNKRSTFSFDDEGRNETKRKLHHLLTGPIRETFRVESAKESVSNPQAVLDGDFQAWISSWTFGSF